MISFHCSEMISYHVTDIIFIHGLVTLISTHNNLLLTEREGRTGEYWPESVTGQTERREVSTKTTEGQYSSVRPEQARLVGLL